MLKVFNAAALVALAVYLTLTSLQSCNARIFPRRNSGEDKILPNQYDVEKVPGESLRRKVSLIRVMMERRRLRHIRSLQRRYKRSASLQNEADIRDKVLKIKDKDLRYENLPTELVAQFGGDIPSEVVKQYERRVPIQTSRQFGGNMPPEYANIPPELIAQFGGNVPPEIVAHFNGQAAPNQFRPPPMHTTENQRPGPGAGVQATQSPIRPPPMHTTENQQRPGQIVGGGGIGNQPNLHPSDLPPVSFGQYNYQYVLKPPSICDNANETAEGSQGEEEQTTAAPGPAAPPDPNIPLTAHQRELILREHNRYRATIQPEAADMRLITWDEELSWISQTFTNSCYYRDIVEPKSFHPNASQVSPAIDLKRHSYLATEIGHTWFAWPRTYGLPMDFIASSIDAWESEKTFYDEYSKQCDGICEHFLQLIWAETFKLGCSAAWCEEPNINGIVWPQAILFVCSYTPRGGLANFMAASPRLQFLNPKLFIEPYQKGRPCSLCVIDSNDPDQNIDEMRSTDDKCWNSLCSNNDRDKLIPFIPPARTTTQMWIMTPATSTKSPEVTKKIPSTQIIDVQFDEDDESILVTGEALRTQPRVNFIFCSVLLLKAMLDL